MAGFNKFNPYVITQCFNSIFRLLFAQATTILPASPHLGLINMRYAAAFMEPAVICAKFQSRGENMNYSGDYWHNLIYERRILA